MTHFRAAGLEVVVLFLAVATSLQAATEERHPSDVAKGKNLALGRPYTFSVWPTVKFWLYEQRGVPLPDTDRLLTDGKFAKTELFVLDHEAVVFGNATTKLAEGHHQHAIGQSGVAHIVHKCFQ